MASVVKNDAFSLVGEPRHVRSVESWPGRILTWMYPTRGLGATRHAQGRPADKQKAVRPAHVEPAGFPRGETK
jgi:hypothetical protein